MKKLLILLTALLIASTMLMGEQKNYPKEGGLPTIKNYPREIQLLDSMKTDYFKQKKQHKEKNISYEMSEKYLEKFARVYYKYFMKYSNIHKKGPRSEYIKESYPIGLKMMKEIGDLLYPWDLLYFKKGLILAEIVDDKIMPKRGTLISKYIDKEFNNHVLTVKVIDDIFDSYDRDTILVRHSNSIYVDYKEYKDMNILFTFKPRGSIQRADSVQFIYLLGAPNEFMFVNNDTIYDPNGVLKEKLTTYSKFKSDILKIFDNE